MVPRKFNVDKYSLDFSYITGIGYKKIYLKFCNNLQRQHYHLQWQISLLSLQKFGHLDHNILNNYGEFGVWISYIKPPKPLLLHTYMRLIHSGNLTDMSFLIIQLSTLVWKQFPKEKLVMCHAEKVHTPITVCPA